MTFEATLSISNSGEVGKIEGISEVGGHSKFGHIWPKNIFMDRKKLGKKLND